MLIMWRAVQRCHVTFGPPACCTNSRTSQGYRTRRLEDVRFTGRTSHSRYVNIPNILCFFTYSITSISSMSNLMVKTHLKHISHLHPLFRSLNLPYEPHHQMLPI